MRLLSFEDFQEVCSFVKIHNTCLNFGYREPFVVLVTMNLFFDGLGISVFLLSEEFHFSVFWCQRNISVNILHDLWPISKVLRAQGSHL